LSGSAAATTGSSPCGTGNASGRRADELGVSGPRLVRRRDHAVADAWRLDPLARGDDVPGDLDPRPERRVAVGAEPDPHVGEVDSDRLSVDDDLARAGLRLGRVHDLENLGPAGTAGGDLAQERSLVRN
jgi:hypothetical protein